LVAGGGETGGGGGYPTGFGGGGGSSHVDPSLGATGVAFTNASHTGDGLVTVTYTSPAANTTTTIASDSPDPSAVGQSVAVVTQSRPSPDRPRAGVNAYRKLSICRRNCVENDRRSINAFERL
jgi:hypothetical protein